MSIAAKLDKPGHRRTSREGRQGDDQECKDHPGNGAGLGGLTDDQADNLADELRDSLEGEDLEDLKLGRVVQAAHACGISTQELKELLRDH